MHGIGGIKIATYNIEQLRKEIIQELQKDLDLILEACGGTITFTVINELPKRLSLLERIKTSYLLEKIKTLFNWFGSNTKRKL